MAGKVSLRKLHVNRQGYTSNGQYFGVGPTLYEIVVDGDGIGAIRANNNYESKESVLARAKAGLRETSYGYTFRG
jgi:hypothetical protein